MKKGRLPGYCPGDAAALPVTPGNGAGGFSGPVFWLALILLRAFPCLHTSGNRRSRQAYSSGGCAGLAAWGSFTGFPFNVARQPSERTRNPNHTGSRAAAGGMSNDPWPAVFRFGFHNVHT